MAHPIEKVWGRFKAGFGLTEDEQKESENAEHINRENDEAIEGGYSVSSRIYLSPEIPGLFGRIRRGLKEALSSDEDAFLSKGPR